MTNFLQITTTTHSSLAAEKIAAELVARRLAACAQIVGPIQSIYRWQGAVERAEEWLLMIKSTSEKYPAIETAIRELHTYECPEVIATLVTNGSEAYLMWLRKQVEQEGTEKAEREA